jgi:hypothetical protein
MIQHKGTGFRQAGLILTVEPRYWYQLKTFELFINLIERFIT